MCKSENRNGDGSVVRRRSEASVGEGAARTLLDLDVIIGVIIFRCSCGGSDPVRARGQEDEEGEAIQRVVREREAEKGEDDWAHQGQGWGSQVHSLASTFQAHLNLFHLLFLYIFLIMVYYMHDVELEMLSECVQFFCFNAARLEFF